LERGVIMEVPGGFEGFIKLTLSVTDYFKNKEDAEWKSYLAAY
jgi:hypothetical protein